MMRESRATRSVDSLVDTGQYSSPIYIHESPMLGDTENSTKEMGQTRETSNEPSSQKVIRKATCDSSVPE
jgi:hypothetical protein